MVVETRIEQQVVVVTNTVVQIQPSNPQVVYVPTYNPATVYYPPPPAYVGPPPIVSFAAGVAVGAIIANNCDWHGGGVYVGGGGMVVWGGGGYHGDVDIDVNRNVNVNVNQNVNQNVNANRSASANNTRATGASQTGTTGARPTSTSTAQKWQPDQNRVSTSGSPTAAASAKTAEARGWSSGGARPSTQPSTTARPTASTGSRRSAAGHWNCGCTTFWRQRRRAAFDRDAHGQPAHGFSEYQSPQSIAQRFPGPVQSFGQPFFPIEQRVRRVEQRGQCA